VTFSKKANAVALCYDMHTSEVDYKKCDALMAEMDAGQPILHASKISMPVA